MMKLDTEEVQRVTREMNRYLEGTTIEELMMIRRKRFFYEVRLSETQCRQEIMTLDLSPRAYKPAHALTASIGHSRGLEDKA